MIEATPQEILTPRPSVTAADYKAGFAAGLLTGLLSIPILINLRVKFITDYAALAVPAIVLAIPAGWSLGLFVAHKILERLGWAFQFVKFVIVGFLNTALDFGVLNLLSYITGIYSGKEIIILNSVSFVIAMTNSYFWNKYWTFKKAGEAQVKEFLEFVTVGFIGLLINSGVVFTVTTYIAPFVNFSPEVMENLAKAFATIFSLVWNFVGFKFIVFRA